MTSQGAWDNRLLPKPRLDDLIRLLADDGYEVIGPRIEQQAIVYGRLNSANELPIGWTDRQTPGSYRLEKRDDNAYFGFVVGPNSWKSFLFPPELKLWRAQRTNTGFEVRDEIPEPPQRAFLGVRSCELHGIAVQDQVFLNRQGRASDPYYAKARERLFLIAVECEYPGGNCFCVSMGTGPDVQPERISSRATTDSQQVCDDGAGQSSRTPLPVTTASGAANAALPVCDIVLTELDNTFVVRATSPAGQRIIDRLGLTEALDEQVGEARRRVDAAAESMGKKLETAGIRDLLHRNPEHPRWDDVAGRCLACTNCTLACPTCFCSSVEDVTDLSMENAERVRRWDSCFNPEFGRVHGGNFRPSVRGRYRQWLTHKFASWFDQFDTSGCVGCGRCITWCPAGIDVTEEIKAIRSTDGQTKEIAS